MQAVSPAAAFLWTSNGKRVCPWPRGTGHVARDVQGQGLLQQQALLVGLSMDPVRRCAVAGLRGSVGLLKSFPPV